jgi:hypothetical protein
MSLVTSTPTTGLELGQRSVATLSAEDRAAWRELACNGSISAPFVDEPWVAS